MDCLDCASPMSGLSCPKCGATEKALTEAERIALLFLDDKLYTYPSAVGLAVFEKARGRGSNLPAIGAAVLGKLRQRQLVVYLPDCQGWRISRRGRAALTEFMNT